MDIGVLPGKTPGAMIYMVDSSNPQEKQAWQELHSSLRDNLQKEVCLTRELLSNMHQEEISFILHDEGCLYEVKEQQSSLIERLGSLRLQRQALTDKIEQHLIAKHRPRSVEEMLPLKEEISTEILSLSDQLVCLTERIHRQYASNQLLFHRGHPLSSWQEIPLEQVRSKKKAAVTTYQPNK